MSSGEGAMPGGPIKLLYFDLFARGIPIALALNHSGLEWEGCFCGGGVSSFEGWAELKATLQWRCLPVIEVPDVGPIGQELAILNFLGSLSPTLGGATPIEIATSQQLLAVGEDIYQKITTYSGTRYSKCECGPEEFETFWTATQPTGHNKSFTLKDHFSLVEQFAKRLGHKNKFTASGISVGECKLFFILELTARMSGSVDTIREFPSLYAFYCTFRELKPTLDVLESGGKFPKVPEYYFKTLEVCSDELQAVQNSKKVES